MNKKTNKTVRLLGGMLLTTLLIFIVVAPAQAQDPIADDITATEVTSAGALASAMGDETFASTSASASNDGASACATAKAIASDGETATAVAEAWANIADVAYAYAKAMATAISGIGETVYAYAHVGVSVLPDGTANAMAVTSAGQGRGDNIGNDNNVGEDSEENNNVGNNIVIRPIIKWDSISGFVFGKGDIERYCTFKLQLNDDDSSNDDRASYFMNIIAWDRDGLPEHAFEAKYGITTESCIQIVDDRPKNIEAKDYKLPSYYTENSVSKYSVPKNVVPEYSVLENTINLIPEYSVLEDLMIEDSVYYE